MSMGMACRISLFDSSERVGEGLCLGQAYTAWCKSCVEDIAQVVGKSGRRRDGALRFGGVNLVLTLLNHMKKG